MKYILYLIMSLGQARFEPKSHIIVRVELETFKYESKARKFEIRKFI